jgi:hypothetical protein
MRRGNQIEWTKWSVFRASVTIASLSAAVGCFLVFYVYPETVPVLGGPAMGVLLVFGVANAIVLPVVDLLKKVRRENASRPEQ